MTGNPAFPASFARETVTVEAATLLNVAESKTLPLIPGTQFGSQFVAVPQFPSLAVSQVALQPPNPKRTSFLL